MSLELDLKAYLDELNTIISKLEKAAASEPAGRIVERRLTKGSSEYYFVLDKGTKKQFLNRSNSALISRLLQKRYNHLVFKESYVQRKAVESFLKKYKDSFLTSIFEEFSPVSQQFLNPFKYPFDVLSDRWKRKPYKGNPYPIFSDDYVTFNNEIVRSKSEVIIANCLKEHDVPYKYECPFYTFDKRVIYPDFTILDKNSGKEIYWEHFGRIDSEEYRKEFFKKLEIYSVDGIFPGNGLIVTFEDFNNHLNVNYVKRLIENYL